MTNLTIGDLAQSLMLRRNNAQLTSEMNRLSQELSTGRKTDVSTAVSGDFGPLAGIERQLQTLQAYEPAVTEAALFTQSAQLSLDKIQTATDDLAPRLAAASNNGAGAVSGTLARQSSAAFGEAVAGLNLEVGGRSVFAGAATDRAALVDPQTFLTELRDFVELGAPATAAEVTQRVNDWFEDPAGFAATAYTGSDTGLAPFRVGQGDEARFDVRADSPAVREHLKGLAMAALTDTDLLADNGERMALAEQAGRTLMSNQNAWNEMRAGIGIAEADIESARAENTAQTTALATSRNEITSADPFQTAVELKEVETRLQSLYAITARLSDLSLVNYLR